MCRGYRGPTRLQLFHLVGTCFKASAYKPRVELSHNVERFDLYLLHGTCEQCRVLEKLVH